MSDEIRTLNTAIDRVTVHRRGALVVRVGELDGVATWPVELRIPGLPLLFQSDTLRLRVDAPGLMVGPVEEDAELGGERERRSALLVERDALVVELKSLAERDEALSRLDLLYRGLAVPAELDLSPRARARWPDLDAWMALTDAGERGREALAEERAALRDRIRERQERKDAVESSLKLEDGAPARVTRGLRTQIRHQGASPVPERVVVEVEYFVAGAHWAPSYALDLGADGRARLALLAWVGQATGEDWSGVRVAVSTADLRRSASLPKLPAWKIGRASSPPPSGWRPLPEDLEGLYADADRANVQPPIPRPAPAPVEAPADDEPITAVTSTRQLEKRARRDAAAARSAEASRNLPGAPPPPMMASAPAPMAGGAPPPPMAPPPPQSLSAASMSRGMAMPARAKSAGILGRVMADEAPADLFESGGGAAFAPPPPPPPPLTPGKLLDYAWLRLPRWDERGRRGRLWPVDALSDLRALAEERGESARVQQIERAVQAQRAAAQRLERAPLPTGCAPIDGSAFHFRYPFGPRVDVPGDGRYVQVPVVEGEVSYEALFRVVPRQAPQAFRSVRLDNPLSAPLPAGPVRVSDRGDLRPAGTLGPIGSGGRLTLDLGVEEGLRVARNATYAETERGMLSSQTVGTSTVRTEIQSRLDSPAIVQIFERLPRAPEGSELSVGLESSSREPTRDVGPDGDKQVGALRWELSVPARGKVELSYAYALRLPSKLEVVGGSRREP